MQKEPTKSQLWSVHALGTVLQCYILADKPCPLGGLLETAHWKPSLSGMKVLHTSAFDADSRHWLD